MAVLEEWDILTSTTEKLGQQTFSRSQLYHSYSTTYNRQFITQTSAVFYKCHRLYNISGFFNSEMEEDDDHPGSLFENPVLANLFQTNNDGTAAKAPVKRSFFTKEVRTIQSESTTLYILAVAQVSEGPLRLQPGEWYRISNFSTRLDLTDLSTRFYIRVVRVVMNRIYLYSIPCTPNPAKPELTGLSPTQARPQKHYNISFLVYFALFSCVFLLYFPLFCLFRRRTEKSNDAYSRTWPQIPSLMMTLLAFPSISGGK